MDELAQRRNSQQRRQHRTDGHTAQPLWREVLGARLRRLRKLRGLTLTELAARSGVSAQYLSEIERGRKEPSSEMIAAITGALGLTLVELTSHVADELQRISFSTRLSAQPSSDSASLPPLNSSRAPQLSLVA
ncbi:helix-turn-helix domain-containing protein [Nesterenkonia ebinurensis]|uniref:helix-turn-helix domain-containing protein n=1 Tax=Nesterenkonia ebinurensis TaxID=2608252 RepID=UPI00123CBF5E|nr:helix-turn-helix transcriptional regulator [Nesterenkonia ebinurensis]